MKNSLLLSLVVIGLVSFLIYSCSSKSNNGTGSSHERLKVADVMSEFISCKAGAAEKHSCKEFVAKAICGKFGITDFLKNTEKNEYVPYDEIAGIVSSNGNWVKLGSVSDQSVLDKAFELTKEGAPVLVVSTENGKGNVAIIVKGEMVKSTSWGLRCPPVAIFFPHKPEKSFVDKTLNYAWGSAENLEIYARN